MPVAFPLIWTVARLQGGQNPEHRLTKIVKTSNGGYQLTFDFNGEVISKNAEVLVLALPYSALRHVDLSEAGFSKARMDAIDQMKYGLTSKTFIESDTQGDGRGDDEIIDLDLGGSSVWNTSRNSSKPSLLKTVYSHAPGIQMSDEELVAKLNRDHEPDHKRVLGEATWDTEFAGGSYSIDNNHLPIEGRKTTEVPGRLYFAGEHTMLNPSYMNSAVRSGEVVAARIVREFLSDVPSGSPGTFKEDMQRVSNPFAELKAPEKQNNGKENQLLFCK